MIRERGRLLSHVPSKIKDTNSVSDPNAVAPAAMIKLLNTYLRSNGLAQMDRLTMHSSVEARTPLVDYKLVELILSTQANPASLFASPKQVLREAAAELAPTYDRNRPKKGFTPPIRIWNRMIWQTYRDETRNPVIAQSHFFDSVAVRRILKSPTKPNGQVNQMALRLLTLELWYRGL
jgi:asparagine synthase (glutamine-hydrolysing)